jgi:catechol 2,3-dioxygenase-like lactoylglutathione lyase family enzyme
VTPRITEIAHFTANPTAVAHFYALVLDQRAAESREGESFTFTVDGVTLLVHRADDGETPPGWPRDVDHVAVAVANLDDECARLAAAGFEITGPGDYPWGRSAYLYDPDGRMVELHEAR